MKVNLIIGVNVTLDILFKKEHIITPTTENMSARVRLFDDSGALVAEWMSSEGTYNYIPSALGGIAPWYQTHGYARAADGTYQYPFGIQWPEVIGAGTGLANPPGYWGGATANPNSPTTILQGLNEYNYVPGGITLLHVLMAGLPVVPPGSTQNGNSQGGAAPVAWGIGGNVLDVNGDFPGDPVYPFLTGSGCGNFEPYCYNPPGSSSFAPAFGYFPNYGISGAPDYTGGWSAEVDFVPWYMNNTAVQTLWGVQPFPANLFGGLVGPVLTNGAQYYPPVDGLLMGESYHIIPGTTATSGISRTEDVALTKTGGGRGASMAPNHLGPYSQEGVWQIAGTHLSGEASAVNEVDLNGLVEGYALAFTWSNEFRPLSWGTITVTGAGLPSSGLSFYTYDSLYQAYLPATATGIGSNAYKFTLSSPGTVAQSWTVAVSSGMTGVGQNVYLEQSNIPVPEFNGLAVVAISALAASLYLLRRRRK
jgi:hypothetical protein